MDQVVNSVRNKEFDSNSGLYYLVEAKHLSTRLALTDINNNNNNNNNNNSHITPKLGPTSSAFVSQTSQSHIDSLRKQNNIKNMSIMGHHLYSYNKVAVNFSPKATPPNSVVIKPSDDKYAMIEGGQLEHEEEEEDDDGMLIEELGRDYLSRYNAIRRHTIGTNAGADRDNPVNCIVKSTDCLLKLNEDDSVTSLSDSFALDAPNNQDVCLNECETEQRFKDYSHSGLLLVAAKEHQPRLSLQVNSSVDSNDSYSCSSKDDLSSRSSKSSNSTQHDQNQPSYSNYANHNYKFPRSKMSRHQMAAQIEKKSSDKAGQYLVPPLYNGNFLFWYEWTKSI